MTVKIFTILDKKIGTYHQPVFLSHPEIAKRSYQIAANQPDSHLSTYAEDFSLHEIGEYNPENGQIHAYNKPVWICEIASLRAQAREDEKILPFAPLAKQTEKPLSDGREHAADSRVGSPV